MTKTQEREVRTFVAKMRQRAQLDSELADRLERILLHGGRSQVDHVSEVLAEVGEPMTSNEIAERTGLPPASVRVALYTNQDRFVRASRDGERPVKWLPKGCSAPISERGCAMAL